VPRPKIEKSWQQSIFAQAANAEGRGAHFIRARLVEHWGDVADLPSIKTIGTYLSKFRAMPEDVRQGYRSARWPESFEHGLLPWDAAPVLLELIRVNKLTQPPPVRLVRWLHRVTRAIPTAPLHWRTLIALISATREIGLLIHASPDVQELLIKAGETDPRRQFVRLALRQTAGASESFGVQDSSDSVSWADTAHVSIQISNEVLELFRATSSPEVVAHVERSLLEEEKHAG
jgi:hypothetical protein